MVINGPVLLAAQPIRDMLNCKVQHNGLSHGLAEVGYDIRVKQEIIFEPGFGGQPRMSWACDTMSGVGDFLIASAIEEFQMPTDLMGVVHDKSTWARKGLSVFNTVIEPGWNGFLTLELVYHGHERLHIPAGTGIAQVIFHQTACSAEYDGKYQNQPDRPVEAITKTACEHDWRSSDSSFFDLVCKKCGITD